MEDSCVIDTDENIVNPHVQPQQHKEEGRHHSLQWQKLQVRSYAWAVVNVVINTLSHAEPNQLVMGFAIALFVYRGGN